MVGCAISLIAVELRCNLRAIDVKLNCPCEYTYTEQRDIAIFDCGKPSYSPRTFCHNVTYVIQVLAVHIVKLKVNRILWSIGKTALPSLNFSFALCCWKAQHVEATL